jgi:hypothetical protein
MMHCDQMTTALIVGGYCAVGSALCHLLSEESDIDLVVGKSGQE